MQEILQTVIWMIAIVFAVTVAEMIRELHTFRVREYEIISPKLNGIKKNLQVVLLSDLHNHVYGEKNKKLLDEIRKIHPDLILVAGDMLVGKEDISWEVAAQFAEQLPEICPVYYGNGNHEQRMKEQQEVYGDAFFSYKERLEKAGIHFLENQTDQIKIAGRTIVVTGLELPNSYYKKFRKHFLGKERLEEMLGKGETENFQILIAHNPVFFQDYRNWGADLVVSGHLHGGIIRIPGVGGLITPQAKLFPKYSGELTKEEESYIAVSRGLGSHTVNIRLFNEAEIVALELKPEQEKEEDR